MPYADPVRRKAYAKVANAKCYAKNREAYYARARAHDAKAKSAIREHLLAYLLDHPCVDCSEPDPIVLEFDHRDPSEKLFAIGEAVGKKVSMPTLLAEIAKCDIRCANCHRRKTYRERAWRHRDPD